MLIFNGKKFLKLWESVNEKIWKDMMEAVLYNMAERIPS